MGKIAEKAKKIDMYASLPSLSFGKDGKVYSRLGLLLTFLTIFIIGGMAIWIGIKIFGRQTPSFIQYSLPASSQKLPWDPTDFTFGIALAGRDNYPVVDLTANYTQGQSTAHVPVRICSFDSFPLQNFTCGTPNEGYVDPPYLDTQGYYTYQIGYEYCHRETNCFTEEQSKESLNGYGDETDRTKFIFMYEDLLIDPFNFETPVSTTLITVTDILLLDVGRTLVVTFDEVEFISDNGWIFQDLKTEKKLKATISMKVSGVKIFTVQFTYSGTKTVYKRTYPKIQDFLAQISGLITILTPIFLILVAPYGHLQAIQHMVNEIYEIKLNKSDKGGSQQRSSSFKKKRRSSKSQAGSASPKGTQSNLVPQKAKTKAKEKSKTTPPSDRKSFPFAPHAALVIGGVGKLPTREDTPPIPDENITPFNFEAFDKSPSSPFKLNSITSRHEDESNNLMSPHKTLLDHAKTSSSEKQKPEGEQLNKTLQPIEAKQESEPESESENEEEEVPLRTSDPLEVPWQGWLKSFFTPDPKVQVLNKAKEHIMETFDLVTLSKKVIEIDKLKACLLTHDQRVIFENLPSSVIVLNPEIDLKSPEAIRQYHWKESFKGDETALRKAYSNLQGTKNKLDQLLMRLYESEYLDVGDGDAMVRQIDP